MTVLSSHKRGIPMPLVISGEDTSETFISDRNLQDYICDRWQSAHHYVEISQLSTSLSTLYEIYLQVGVDEFDPLMEDLKFLWEIAAEKRHLYLAPPARIPDFMRRQAG
ncbi:MAG: hypothetical protein GY703_09585 [Gammaproteobacteria bacterium]|nr:hypothetical protein [Gammaproteobacteria bacterium]